MQHSRTPGPRLPTLPTPERALRLALHAAGRTLRRLEPWWAAHHAQVIAAAAIAMAAYLAVCMLRTGSRRRWEQAARQVEIAVPPQVDTDGAMTFWTNLHGLLRPAWHRVLIGQPPLSFDFHWENGQLRLSVWVAGVVPPGLVERAAAAAWPAAQTTTTPADSTSADQSLEAAARPAGRPRARRGTRDRTRRWPATAGFFGFVRAPWLPLATDFAADPLRAVLGAVADLPPGWTADLRMLAAPAGAGPARAGHRAARALVTTGTASRDPLWQRAALGALRAPLDLLTPSSTSPPPASRGLAPDPARGEQVRQILGKATGSHWHAAIRYVVTAPPAIDTPGSKAGARVRWQRRRWVRAELRGRAHALASALGAYDGPNALTRRRCSPAAASSRRLGRRPMPLSTPELAGLAHLPHDPTVPGLNRAGARRAPVPPQAATTGKILGDAPGGGRPVALLPADARYHLHVLGATGAGKSTLLTNMIVGDIAAGRGTVVIDPKGDLITDVLARIPAEAASRVVLIDPDDAASPPALDPLDGADVDLAVDNLVGIFRRIFEGFWGPRTDDVLRSALLTLLHYRDAQAAADTAAAWRSAGQSEPRRETGCSKVPEQQMLPAVLPQVSRLLTDAQFRRPRVAAVAGRPELASFWTGYNALSDGARAQITAPLMNKLRAFLLRDYVANLVGSTTSSFQMETVLDGGVLLARLPKGVLGEETSRLLGSFVIASVWQAATARARRGQDARVDAALYVDECQNFLTLPRSFEEMLAEARGYRLSLVLAHQHLGQLPRDLKEAVAANARTKVYFTVSPDDARQLAKHTVPDLSEHDLAHLPAYTAAVRLLRDGQELPACTVSTRPALDVTDGSDAVRAAARENWGRTAAQRAKAGGRMDRNADLPQ